jgi:ubiquitin-activating enzyme E1
MPHCNFSKKMVLMGVKSVTLHDVANVEMQDLSSNFFLTEKDIGTNRGLACVMSLLVLQ